MKKHIIEISSYEETLHNLAKYHQEILLEVKDEFKFSTVSAMPFIALRKSVELGFVCSPLSDWEQAAVAQHGKKPIFDEYYPLILDFVRHTTIPKKSCDYACGIDYFHLFSPICHKNMICSFFVNFFEKPIFKNFNLQHASLEQQLVLEISTFFRKQNKFGPERISVSILDDQFTVIMVSCLLTPFLKEFIDRSKQVAGVIEEGFILQTEKLLEEIIGKYFDAKPYKPFIFFDKAEDKIIAIVCHKWEPFLDKTCT